MSFRGSEASRGIFPSGKLYLVLVILATWEDPSTPFHFGRDDMSGGGTIQPHRLYSGRGGRQIAAPTDTLVGGTIHPHKLYSLHCLAMNHRRYIAWFHSTTRVVFETWRAASSRPYGRGTYHPTQVIFGTYPGTAHRPFPTVSLIRPFFNHRDLKTSAFCPVGDKRHHAAKRRIVNCPLSIVNWRSAHSRNRNENRMSSSPEIR